MAKTIHDLAVEWLKENGYLLTEEADILFEAGANAVLNGIESFVRKHYSPANLTASDILQMIKELKGE